MSRRGTYLYIYAKVTFFSSIRHKGRSSRAGGPLAQRSIHTAAQEHASQGPLSRNERRPASLLLESGPETCRLTGQMVVWKKEQSGTRLFAETLICRHRRFARSVLDRA